MNWRNRTGLCAVVLAGLGCGAVQGQWSNAARFDAENGTDCKTGGIAPATGGGFHFLYQPNNSALRYRRYYANGTLSSPLTLFYGTTYNSEITESLNGDIHVVFEDWSQGPNNIRWYKSTNAGASFATTQMLTSTNCAKHPHVAAFGMGQSPEVIMSYYRSDGDCDDTLWFRRFNGATWSAEGPLNSPANSEFDCFGMARSPLDGSVYRTFDPSENTMAIRRYNGSWESQIQIYSGSWAVRQHMAINQSGQIMLLWDDMSRIKAMLYTPGSGSSAVVDLGPGGYSGACDVCAIPGTNDFYMVVARNMGGTNNFHVYGRRWSNGSWLTEESVQNNQSNAFIVTPLVTADAAGNIYCVWEYWGYGKPQQWFAIRPTSAQPGPKGYVSGLVRDSLGNALSGAMVLVQNVGSVLTSANGNYQLQVPAGTHTIQVSRLNYDAQTLTGVVVVENGTTTNNVTLAAQAPAPLATLTVTPGNRENYLSWVAPGNTSFSGVLIRFSTSGYPTSINDGQPLIDLAGTPGAPMSFIHSGLPNGTACYYSAFTYFQDAGRFYNMTRTSGAATPAGPGDYDRDGDVDQTDFALFQLCLSGQYISQPDTACARMKFDADDDVDQDDVGRWQTCFSGPAIPSNPYCAN